MNFKFKAVFPFLNWLPMVNKQTMQADLIAGLTGAIIALPQGVAFAMIAGMPPIYGLYAAMITPIIAALFGSSHHLVSGPTTPISIVVFSAISGLGVTEFTPEFVKLALSLTFLVGLIQLVLGLVRLGAIVNFVSHTVVIGFTAGAGVLIAGKQLESVFGISIDSGTPFQTILYEIVTRISETNIYVLIVALSTLFLAIGIKKISKRLPYMLISMVGGSIIAILIGGENVGIEFVQELPSELPPFLVPDLSLETLQKLAPNAFAIAMLGLIEAVAISRSIALDTRQPIDGNQEFIGQGLSNLVTSFFSGYVGSGSFSRSGVNHQAGAKTPFAAVFSAIILMLVVLFVAPLAAYLPIPAMAGIILLVGYNLVDIPHIKEIVRASKLETAVLTITFFSTLLLNLEFAIYIGVIFSLIFYLQKTSKPHIATLAPNSEGEKRRLINVERKPDLPTCPQLKMIRIDGELYYGAIETISTEFNKIFEKGEEKNVLILASSINFIDLAGAEWLLHEAKRWREKGGNLYVSGLKQVAQDVLIKGGFKEKIGEEYFYKCKKDAIQEIYSQLDPAVCAACKARIFEECN